MRQAAIERLPAIFYLNITLPSQPIRKTGVNKRMLPFDPFDYAQALICRASTRACSGSTPACGRQGRQAEQCRRVDLNEESS
jgi:hypothetical protein